jgi:hypothetical protein
MILIGQRGRLVLELVKASWTVAAACVSHAARLACALGMVMMALSTAATAQADTTGTVRGTVLASPSGEPISGAAVVIVGTGRGMLTGDDGRFSFDRVTAGRVTVRARALAYRETDVVITLPRGGTADTVIRLERAPLDLGTITTRALHPDRELFNDAASAGVLTIAGETVRTVPVIGEADVLRTVQLLPGVVARNDFSAGYNVRGGESDQNLVLLDGIPVYNPFHFGGLFGTFLEPTVGSVQLLVGGFPAEYGGRLSSVLDVTSADEARRGTHGTVGVSLLASSVSLAGALPDRGTSWSLAARRTYADVLTSALTDKAFPYHFQDAQFHARQRLPHDASIAVTAYAGTDAVSGDIAQISDSAAIGAGTFDFSWGNVVAGATLTIPFGVTVNADGRVRRRPTLTQRISYSHFATTLDLGDGSLSFENRVNETHLFASMALPHGTRNIATVGYEYSQHALTYDAGSAQADLPIFQLVQRPATLSLFADEIWRPSPRLQLRGGVRAEHVTGTSWSGISPRLAATYFVSPDMSLSLSGGRFTQWMHGLRNEDIPVRIFDFWIASDRYVEVSSAHHAVLGVERWMPHNRVARVEAYVKRYDRLLEQNSADDPDVRGDEFIPANGRSVGLDVLLRQLEGGSLSGWIAYSFGVNRRERAGNTYAPAQDRRHNLNVVASYKLGDRTTLGARLGIGTGLPYTDIVGQIVRRQYDPTTNTWTEATETFRTEAIGGDRNGKRYPPFQRLDVSATRRYTVKGLKVTPSLSIVNVYNRRNVWIYTFDFAANPPTRQATSQFPFLPSIGVTVEF